MARLSPPPLQQAKSLPRVLLEGEMVRCFEPGGVLDKGLFTPHYIWYGAGLLNISGTDNGSQYD